MDITINIPNHKTVSWNKLYSQNHWALRKRLADEIHNLIYARLIELDVCQKKNKKVRIKVDSYAKRPIDSDNICAKLYIDGIKRYGIIKDDTYEDIESVCLSSHKSKSDETVITIEILKR